MDCIRLRQDHSETIISSAAASRRSRAAAPRPEPAPPAPRSTAAARPARGAGGLGRRRGLRRRRLGLGRGGRRRRLGRLRRCAARRQFLRRGDRRGLLAVGQPDVVDGVIDGVQAGARGEHPAVEDALHLARQRDLVDLDEGVGLRRLGRRPREADPRRHLERAELHRLVDIDVERDDPAGDLVEPGENGDRVGELLLGERGEAAPGSTVRASADRGG